MRYQQVEWRSVAALPSIGFTITDFKLASDAPNVSPLLSSGSLEKTLRRLPSGAIQRTLRHGVVPVAWWPDHVLYATCGQKGTDYATYHGLPVMARIEQHDFHRCVRRVWGRRILWKATHGLLAARPQFSAKTRVTGPQMFCISRFHDVPLAMFNVSNRQCHLDCRQCIGRNVFPLRCHSPAFLHVSRAINNGRDNKGFERCGIAALFSSGACFQGNGGSGPAPAGHVAFGLSGLMYQTHQVLAV